ncbi:hypothetical protein BHE74_00039666 [Ensete ventricosum]|nr:hypothetical protein BHE74_00039666 [Ensete ventricosum]
MLHPGVTQEWVGEGELPRERTKNRRWQRLYDVLAEVTRGEVIVRVHHTRICMQRDVTRRRHGAADHGGIVRGNAIQAIRSYWELHFGMIGVAGELDCFSAHIRLREPDKSEDKAECKSTNSRAMGLAVPWYRRGGTSVESSIPCSHGGRALIMKGAEEVENAKANSKYQDKAEGQRPRNFIRLMSMGFSS